MSKILINNVSKYVSLNSDEEKLFTTYWRQNTLEKDDYLLRNGDVCRTDNFIVSGSLKAYYINSKNGKEEILYFAIDNWWATDIESFQRQIPSLYNIQAVEKTEVLQIQFDSFQEMLRKIPKLERFFRIILENYLASLQKRIVWNNVYDAEKRYFDFLENYPEIARRIPQYLIASYLGISAEFLSRIRKKT
jgi:CRP-like cAMP-binding protein